MTEVCAVGAKGAAPIMGKPERLQRDAHGCTRELWQEVFPEDTEAYLDYYYKNVADKNLIYVERENHRIVSMIHLNPYGIHMGSQETDVHYIVAVGTREKYRQQGRMRELLETALKEIRRMEEPFTFLTPAAEAIYLPFGFRTVARQSILSLGQIFQGKMGTGSLVCRRAKFCQIKELAEFSEEFLSRRCRTFVKRDVSYYTRLWKEQQAMGGEILLFYRGEELAGYCFSGCEEIQEVWEVAVKPKDGESNQEQANGEAVEALTRWFKDKLPLRISGFLPGTGIEGIPEREVSYRPLTMARIVHLPAFAKRLHSKEPVEFVVKVEDPILSDNCGCFQFQISPQGGKLCPVPEVSGIPVLSPGELTQLLFGRDRLPNLPLEKLEPLCPVYFNELV